MIGFVLMVCYYPATSLLQHGSYSREVLSNRLFPFYHLLKSIGISYHSLFDCFCVLKAHYQPG